MENPNEIWQAEVNGEIYDGSFDELAQWIHAGALLPDDKVRRGNLRWIPANKVPALCGYFEAVTTGSNQPITQTINAAQPPEFTKLDGINCVLHNDVEAKFYCETCVNYFCRDCPKTVGGSTNCCPLCGAICAELRKDDVSVTTPVLAHEENIPPEIKHAAHQTNNKYYSTPRVDSTIHAPKKGVGRFIFGVIFIFFLAAGCGYLYAFQYVTPDETAEAKITQVAVLEEKYSSDRQGLRLLFANVSVNGAGETMEQAQAKLKAKFDNERTEAIANFRSNRQMNKFYMVAGIAFAVMLFGLILMRGMSAK